MNRGSTFGLNVEQLTELLSVGEDTDELTVGICSDREIAALLRARLAATLPKDHYLLGSLLLVLGRLGYEVNQLVGKSLGEVLMDRQTNVGLLQAIKDHSKAISGGLVSAAEASVATTIYYAAVAGALAHHDKRISRYSHDALHEAFALLAEKAWMTPELGRLFRRACEICKEKRSEK